MKKSSFKNLDVSRRAYTLSLSIHRETGNFPKTEQYGLTDQIRRASRSICANIAEGYSRQLTSDNDFKRFLIIARGSCHETAVWIDYCYDLGLVSKETNDNWQSDYEIISKMLYNLIKSLNPQPET